jgi:Acetyltransferase (GNAT) family
MIQSQAPIRLDARQAKAASELLGRAFMKDPMWEYLAPGLARRARVLPPSFGITVRYSLRYGEVYTTPALDGVACWLTPGVASPSLSQLIRLSIHGAPLELGLMGLLRYTTVENYTSEIHKRTLPGRHWYLWVIGVEPARQGQGIGAMLIQPVLARADASGFPCYLETMNEANVPFYQKHGFEIVSKGEVPRRGLRVWAMLREPRF